MPQLPSGRHVGISPDLDELWHDALNGRHVHVLMAIDSFEDVKPFISVVELIPSEQPSESGVGLDPLSTPFPLANFIAQPTGFGLNQMAALAARWPASDVFAFEQWLAEPACQSKFDALMVDIRNMQRDIFKEGSYLARVTAGWWVAGCHPAQEEGW